MKRKIWLTICLLIPVLLPAQVQQGYVKTKGRLANNGSVIAGTRLSGAIVTIKGGNSVISGNNGKFSLSIVGNNYYLQNVEKKGYVLTDPDILSKQYEYSKNPLVLVLETPSQQADDKLAAQKKIHRTLQRQLQEKEDEIESLKEQKKISDEEYRKLLQEIYTQQENNERLITPMADRYSQIDFDELDDFNRRISQLILEGKLTEADSLINTKGDINTRTTEFHQLQKQNARDETKKKKLITELTKLIKELTKNRKKEERVLDDIAKDCYSKYEIFKMLHQYDSAAHYIEWRAQLDTINVNWQQDAGLFLVDNNNRFEDGLKYFNRALSCGKQQSSPINCDVAYSHFLIGSTYHKLGDNDKALKHFQLAIEAYLQLKENGTRGLAMCYNSIGVVYLYIGKNEQAMEYIKKGLDIRQAIEDKDEELIESIAASYSNLGGIYHRLENNEEALRCFEKSLELRKSLKTGSKRNIAISYNNVGYSYHLSGEDAKAMECYMKALDIRIELWGNIHPHVAISLNNIAGLYYNQKEYEKALNYYLQSLSIRVAIYGDNHIDVAISYYNLGTTYYKLSRYSEALECFENAMKCAINNSPNDIYNLKKTIQDYIEETKSKMMAEQ